ncbi:UNVERIFIED_CONTAM: hypothetical protein K2H54_077793 [Gekko kuhli]
MGHFQKGAAVPPACRHKGWVYINGHCYKLFTEKALWLEAELQCRDYSRNSHLVSLHNEQEAAVVVELIKAQESHEVWIGLYAENTKGLWWWTDDSEYNYVSWALGEPDFQGSQKVYCVQLSLIKGEWNWEAMNCDTAKAYVCQYKP